MRIWLRLLLQEPTVARFVSEVCPPAGEAL